jgi:hypothetical protein
MLKDTPNLLIPKKLVFNGESFNYVTSRTRHHDVKCLENNIKRRGFRVRIIVIKDKQHIYKGEKKNKVHKKR